MYRARLIAAAVMIFVAPSAHAAKVSVIPQAGTLKGNLFLNNGRGFAPIVNVTEAHTGDTLIASGTGRALVVYDDGCKVEVNSTTAVVYVQESSPCKGGVLPEATRGAAVGKYVIGAALVGGGIAAAVLIGGGGGDDGGSGKKDRDQPGKPASP